MAIARQNPEASVNVAALGYASIANGQAAEVLFSGLASLHACGGGA
jgi:hypothetical protein